jgi:hypothetical protein
MTTRAKSAKQHAPVPVEAARIIPKIQEVCTVLNPESKNEWDKRVEVIKSLDALADKIHGLSAESQDALGSVLIKLGGALASQIIDLRSEVTGSTFEILPKLCSKLNFSRAMQEVMPQLIEQSGSTNSVIRVQARVAAEACMRSVLCK